jgi:hypothetical protein
MHMYMYVYVCVHDGALISRYTQTHGERESEREGWRLSERVWPTYGRLVKTSIGRVECKALQRLLHADTLGWVPSILARRRPARA